MGQRAKNAGKKKSKTQEPKLATELCGEMKDLVSTNRGNLLTRGRATYKGVNMNDIVNYLSTGSVEKQKHFYLMLMLNGKPY